MLLLRWKMTDFLLHCFVSWLHVSFAGIWKENVQLTAFTPCEEKHSVEKGKLACLIK